jgi:hypothetical protein
MPIWGFSFGGNMYSSGQVETLQNFGRAAQGGDGFLRKIGALRRRSMKQRAKPESGTLKGEPRRPSYYNVTITMTNAPINMATANAIRNKKNLLIMNAT